ncbi:MAG: hypothetical protein R3C03_08625 [Pirellulaceae bacterium]
MNDVLLAGVFQSLALWINKGTIRVAVPVAMRSQSDRGVCNLVSMVFLDRTPKQIKSNDLLQSVASEMRNVHSKDLGHAMITFLKIACICHGQILKYLLKVRGCSPTLVLTNLGKPFAKHSDFRIGAAKLIAFDSLAPLRPGTSATISVSEFEGRLKFTIRFHPDVLARSDAQEILKVLLTSFGQLLEVNPQMGT